MKQTVNILNGTAQQSKSRMIIASALILLFMFCQIAFAQNAPNDKSLKSYKLPPNLKKHLQDKYKDKDGKDQITRISSNLQETPQGPRGRLWLSGHIRPKNFEATSGDKYAHARAIAMAFLKEEAELLGLPDLNELRESKIKADMGHDGEYTDIYYDRYIGDVPFESGDIHITIGPDESIRHVTASLLPVPSETYQAVTKKTITEDDALKIVKRDIKAHGWEPDNMKVNDIRKFASNNSPYVFWGLDVKAKYTAKQMGPEQRKDMGSGWWGYIIDAFTGDIYRKRDKSRTAE